MAVYVDRFRTPFRQIVMSHMLADTLDELLAMADQVGLRRQWLHADPVPHFDISQAKRKAAIDAGAIEIGRRQTAALMARLREGSA
jgi:hypothetical protein